MNNSSAMTNLKMLLMEHGLTLWRHKWIALGTAWLVCVLGWTSVMFMPRQYESNARAFVDVNGLLTPLLKGLVVDTSGAQSSEYLRQTLLSRPNLEQVISLAQLDTDLNQAEKEALILDLSTRINVDSRDRNLFTISYVDPNPVQAKNVVESLLTIFAEKASSSNRLEMEKARKFLDDQIAAYEEQLRAAELRSAEFRKQYADYLADPASGTPKMQALQQQVNQARTNYEQALLTRDSLVAQLKLVPQFRALAPAFVVGVNGTVTAGGGPSGTRLEQARALLSALKQKYTDLHPDVIAASNMVAELERQAVQATPAAPAAEGANASVTPASAAPGPTETNPTYDQIKLRLVDAETMVPVMRQRLSQATTELERVRALTAEIPDIDAKNKDLDRDYEIIKKNHEELVSRRESATLSQAADDQADRTQFRIVDPPQIPLNPSFPNLPIMFSLVLLVGLGTGAVIPIGLEMVKATFASSMRLRDLGLPVIGSVTLAQRSGLGRGFVAGTAGAVITATALLAVYGTLLVLSSTAYRGIL